MLSLAASALHSSPSWGRRLLVVVVGLAMVAGLVTVSGPTATAATALGGLSLDNPTGRAGTPITITTVSTSVPAGCPAGAGRLEVVGTMTGPGAWADGILVVSSTSAGVSTSSDFSVPLADTFGGIAQSNGIAIVVGRYDLRLDCILAGVTTGTFTTPLWFTTTNDYQTTDPAGPAATTTSLVASPASTSSAGATVTLTATVGPSAATGTVVFRDMVAGVTTDLSSAVAVSGGQASFQTSALAVGAHAFTAQFTPAQPASYAGSTSPSVAHTVTGTATSVAVTVSPAGSAVVGRPVTISAAVLPAAAAGTVQFTDTVSGVASPIGGAVAVTSGAASTTMSSLAQGSHSFTATFTPSSAQYVGSTSPAAAYSVVAAPLLGSLSLDPPTGTDLSTPSISTVSSGAPAGCRPSGAGTMRALVTASGPGGWSSVVIVSITSAGVSTSADFSLPIADTWSGIAQSNGLTLTAGRYDLTLTCDQGGVTVGRFTSSVWFTSATAYQSTDPAGVEASTVSVAASPVVTAVDGGTVTLTATVTPAGAQGSVQFRDTRSGTTSDLGTPVTVSGGTAVLTTTSLAVGSHIITAVFTPSNPALFSGSTSAAVAYTITGAASAVATTTTLAVDPTTPVLPGTAVTLTATVAPSAAAGTVEFTDVTAGGSTPLGSAAVVSGSAVTTTAGLPVGSRSVRASFVPADSAAYQASQSSTATVQVQAPPRLGGLSFDPATGLADTPMSLSTVASGVQKGCPAGAGRREAAAFATGPGGWSAGILVISRGAAGVSDTSDFTLSFADTMSGIAQGNGLTIEVGRYDIRLECYLGQVIVGYYESPVFFTTTTAYQSTDPANTQTVVTVALSASPVAIQEVGKPVTFTATLSPASAAGSVQLRNTAGTSTVPVGSPVAASGGQATLTTSSLAFGMYSLTALFTPTNAALFTAATSPTLTYVVRKADPPVPGALPSINGAPRVGAKVTCLPGTWTGATGFAYSWTRNGARLAVTGARITVPGAAYGGRLACVVSASNSGGVISRSSPAKSVAIGPALTKISAPRISGKGRVGAKLSAIRGSWTPKPTSFTFQWLRNGRPVAGATTAKYTVKRADKGKKLTVRVTAKAYGYVSASAKAKAVRIR